MTFTDLEKIEIESKKDVKNLAGVCGLGSFGERGAYLFKNDKHIIAVITGVTADHEKALSFCN